MNEYKNKMAHVSHAVYIFLLIIRNVLTKPNIILILSDDQDLMLGGLTPMSHTIEDIANYGVTFANAFVNSPICCPSRSTLLTGRHQHNTGVRNNSVSGGCASENWRKNYEPHTIASLLHTNGYSTFYAGKYLNEYGTKSSGSLHNVPQGWDEWHGLVGNSKYYNYNLIENGKIVHYTDYYLTDLIKDKALKFLCSSSSPVFMILAVPAPHAPATAAPRHRSAFPKVKAVRTPAFNATTQGKHWLLRQSPVPLPPEAAAELDTVQKHRLQTLLAVDELVKEVVEELKKSERINDTYFIYTSDNGYHIGQFSQPWDKRQPYDTDIRVPLLIRGPGLPVKFVTNTVAQFVDLTPTMLDMAGIPTPSYMDGQSFLSELHKIQLRDAKTTNILIEYQGEGNAKSNDKRCPMNDDTLAECGWDSWCKCQDSRNNTYSCVRQLSDKKDFLFCRFKDKKNFVEAYNMTHDKYQLNNIYATMKKKDVQDYMALLDRLVICKGSECRI